MDRWKVENFFDYLAMSEGQAQAEGYLVESSDPLSRESLRQFITWPEWTLNRPVKLAQEGRILNGEDSIDLQGDCPAIDLVKDSQSTVPKFQDCNLEKRHREAFLAHRTHIVGWIDRLLDLPTSMLRNTSEEPVQTFDEMIGRFVKCLTPTNQLKFMFRIAQVVHQSPFENFSKFLGAVPFRCGYEMWRNISLGFGGVCAEKTAAIQFLCDILEIPTRSVLGSRQPIPGNFLEQLETYLTSEGEAPLPIWIQHLLIEIEIGGCWYLIDVTNGNIPLLFLDEADADLFIQNGYRSRMISNVECLNLQRMPRWAGDALLTISEYHVPDLHFRYVFDQGLGLLISRELFVGAFFSWGQEVQARMENHFSSLARSNRLLFPRFVHEGNLQSVADEFLQELLCKTLRCLREQYRSNYYTGDFIFVLQPLTTPFWQHPRISRSVSKALGPGPFAPPPAVAQNLRETILRDAE